MTHPIWRTSIVLVLFGLLLAATASAQDAARVGLGVSISDFGDFLIISSEITPASNITPTIFVPINVSSRFRIEPEMGVAWASSTNSSGRTDSTSVVHARSGTQARTDSSSPQRSAVNISSQIG